MAALAETTVDAAAEGKRSDLRSFFAKRGVAVDIAEVDDQALKELEEKYIIARDLDTDTVLSKIQNLVGLRHKEDSIIAYEGLSYQLPSRGLEQQEYDPLLRQLCLRRGKVDCCAVSDPKTSHWAKVITAVLSSVQEQLLNSTRTTSYILSYGEKLFEKGQKTVDDALLDICCLLECTRKSLNLYHPTEGMVYGRPLIFTREDGLEFPCISMGPEGAYVQQGFSKITVTPGAEVKFILVVQGALVFDAFVGVGGRSQFLSEFSCVIVTGGDGQPDITTRAFLRKLADDLSVPVYALVNPDPEGLSIFCTYKYGSSEGPSDNVGLTVPGIKLIGVPLGDALALDIEDGQPLTKEDISILEGLCAKRYVMDDELLRTNIHYMMYRGVKSKIEALFYRQYPPTDYIREAINNQEDVQVARCVNFGGEISV